MLSVSIRNPSKIQISRVGLMAGALACAAMNLGRASHETVCRPNTEAMKHDRLILVDSDAYTSSVLEDRLHERGFGMVQSVASTL